MNLRNGQKEFKKGKNFYFTDSSIKKRYIQIRAILETQKYDRAPQIKEIKITGEIKYLPPSENLKVVDFTEPHLIETSIPFVYQTPDHRTRVLRNMYMLDEVIKDAKTEFEKLVKLRNWARHTATKGWDLGTSMWCPPWDALVILATNKQPLALCMCTHYSTIFVQSAIALGFTARHVILDHHCVAEVWSDQFKKWILMDTGNSQNPDMNCHLEHNGVPLNALEIRKLWKAGKSSEIKFVYANEANVSNEEKRKFESIYFQNFRRFAIPLRNNFLGNPEPGEMEQGMAEYYCDMYLWWEDGPEIIESPEYGKISCREQDFYWTVNQTFIDLFAEGEDSLKVTFYNNAPAFSHYLVNIDGKGWKKSKSFFDWNLKKGKNELQAKIVNEFGLEGPVSKIIIEKN